jgi:hypothetical protein
MTGREKWGAECRLCCVEEWYPYFLRHTDSSHIDLFNMILLQKCQSLLYNIT